MDEIKFGDHVEVDYDGEMMRGIVIKIDPENNDRIVIERSYFIGNVSSFYPWHIRKNMIVKNHGSYYSVPVKDDEKIFNVKELIDIIDQDKPAEEVLLDIKDHITN